MWRHCSKWGDEPVGRPRHRPPHALLRKAKPWGPVGFASVNGWAGCRPTRGAGGGATGSARGAPRVRPAHRLICCLSILLGARLIVSAAAAPLLFAEEKSSDTATVQKTSDGLHFNVPSDWPIEKRNGVTGPIPIEEYLARKFKALEAQLQALEQRLSSFDIRLRVMEEELKKSRQGLRSAEPASSASSAPATSTEGAKPQ